MKKIFAIIMVAFMLIGMIVPINAEEETEEIYGNEFMFYGNTILPNVSLVAIDKYDYPYVSILKTGENTYNLIYSKTLAEVTAEKVSIGECVVYSCDMSNTTGWSHVTDLPLMEGTLEMLSTVIWCSHDVSDIAGNTIYMTEEPQRLGVVEAGKYTFNEELTYLDRVIDDYSYSMYESKRHVLLNDSGQTVGTVGATYFDGVFSDGDEYTNATIVSIDYNEKTPVLYMNGSFTVDGVYSNYDKRYFGSNEWILTEDVITKYNVYNWIVNNSDYAMVNSSGTTLINYNGYYLADVDSIDVDRNIYHDTIIIKSEDKILAVNTSQNILYNDGVINIYMDHICEYMTEYDDWNCVLEAEFPNLENVPVSDLIWTRNNITDADGNVVINEGGKYEPPEEDTEDNTDPEEPEEPEEPEGTCILKAGIYVFKDYPVLPNKTIVIDMKYHAIFQHKDDFSLGYAHSFKYLTIDQTSIYYSGFLGYIQGVDTGDQITAYIEPPYANAGWQNELYREIFITEDIEVTQSAYDWIIENTNRLLNINKWYIFHDDGITYDNGDVGVIELIGTYVSDATPRININNGYGVMYYKNNNLCVAISQSPFYLLTYQPGIIYSSETIEEWIIAEEKIIYNGSIAEIDSNECTMVAGNQVILDENAGANMSFDISMKQSSELIFEETTEDEEKGILDILLDIFYPEDYVSAKWVAMREKFKFADSIAKTAKLLFEFLINTDFNTPPQIEINFGLAESKYNWGSKAMVLDMSWYARYKPTIDAFLTSWIWIVFVVRTFVRLPSIIGGVSSDFDMHNKKSKK